ncbi:unnamed protein product [Amoebophrya sp. A120]|nr:unnamed protein product [Amoebophrya sp. A120]|eukprot:GSA120T00017546001.1
MWKNAQQSAVMKEYLRERAWGLFRVALFFTVPMFVREEAARSQAATVGVLCFFLLPLGFVPESRKLTVLVICVALQVLMVTLHALLPQSTTSLGPSGDPLLPAASSDLASPSSTAGRAGEHAAAQLQSPLLEAESASSGDDLADATGLPKSEAPFHRPFAELIHTPRPPGAHEGADASAGTGELKHTPQEDSVSPILYHLSTRQEEDAHLGGIAEKITNNVISLVLTASADDTPEEVAATLRSFLLHTEPVSSIAEAVVVDATGGARFDAAQLQTGAASPDIPGSSALRVRLYQSTEPQSLGGARNAAAAMTTGSILVFLDAHMRASRNWMVPLVRDININYKRVVTSSVYALGPTATEADPRHDVRTYKMAFRNWALSTAWVDDMTNRVAVMKGNALAITRKWWRELGLFEEWEDFETVMSEYSIRTWLAGGEIQVARDSVLGETASIDTAAADPALQLEDRVRLVEKWFSKNAKAKFYASAGGADQYRQKHEYPRGNPSFSTPPLSGSKGKEESKGTALTPESATLVEEDPESGVVLHRGRRIDEQKYKELKSAAESSEAKSSGTPPKDYLECHGFAFYADLFADEFVNQQMLTPRTFRLEAPGVCTDCCVSAFPSNPHYRLETCSSEKSGKQDFYWYFGNGLRNVQTRNCMDAAFPQQGGHVPIGYPCMKVNRNQEWQFLHHKLMWGSWCLEGNPDTRFLTFQRCNSHTRKQEFNLVENDVPAAPR